MARSTNSLFEGNVIAVRAALELRDKAKASVWRTYRFHCVECGKRVRPHKASFSMAAHFEHQTRNPECSLSDPGR